MSFQPPFPLPLILGLVLAAAVLGAWSARRAPESRAWHVLLRLGSVLLLGLILLNPVKRSEVDVPGLARTRLLVDTSASMGAFGRTARAEAAIAATKAACPPNAQPDVVRFSDQIDGPADGVRTHLGGALLTLLKETSRSETGAITLISDGVTEDEALLAEASAMAREQRIPISVLDPGADAPVNLALSALRTPRTVRAGETAEVRVRVQSSKPGALPAGAQVVLLDPQGGIAARAPLTGAASQEVTLSFQPLAGDQRYTVQINGSPEGSLADDNTLSFQLEGGGRALRILYVEGTPWTEPLGDDIVVKLLPIAWGKAGLQVDCWFMEDQVNEGGRLLHASSLGGKDYSGQITFDDSQLPTDREWWDSFDLYVVSDVNRKLFTPDMINWVREAVTERGAGFVMIGGNTSFDTGGWQNTAWEKIIPAAIREHGRGMIWTSMQGQVPQEARSHPLWQIDPNPDLNNLILDAHPRFLGYHRILKEKPGATVLLQSTGGEKQPLIMVQQYGRGRAMAFLSDAAGGWGAQYENWGPESLSTNLRMAAKNAPGAAELIRGEMERYTGKERLRRYYEKFWQNAAQWLAAGSVSTRDRTAELRAAADRTAGVLRIDTRTGLQASRAEVRFGTQNGQLARQEGTSTWSGTLPLPAHLSGAAPLSVEAALRAPEGDKSEALPVGAAEVTGEFLATAPRRDLLEKLARETGGKVLAGPEAVAAAAAELAREGRVQATRTDPAWAHAWLWLAVFGLLGAEWTLRRRHGS